MDETFFPVIWRNDGYRSSFLEPYLRREVGGAGARPVPALAPGTNCPTVEPTALLN